MSSSPKSSRTSPSNKFEDYILTYTVGQSLYPIRSDIMTYLDSSAGQPFTVNASDTIDIGFSFKFDNRSYRRVYVSTRGFAILLDPSANPSNVITDTMGSVSANHSVLNGPWSSAHVILSLWWDSRVRSIFRKTSDSDASDYITLKGTTIPNINLGIDPYPAGIDGIHGGIKKFYGFDKRDGKFLLLRWKIFSYAPFSEFISGNLGVVSFDLVLYESGIIEYRYAPRFEIKSEQSENATIAIFASGGSTYANRYRDFSYVVRPDSRGKYRNGGAVYGNSYTDNDGTNTSPYTITLRTDRDWPGLDRGAMFRLTPPRNKRKQSRKVLNSRDSIDFVKTGMFNDQKTINFSKQAVHFPSMLPLDYVTSMNDTDSISVIELHRSGSIEVSVQIKSGLFDDVMFDSSVERGKK